MTTLLPTTLVGSLPKPSWLAQEESLWAPWKLSGDELQEGRHDALALAVADQLRAGVDLVCDGEQTRRHFVTTFIEHLGGVDFERRETVRIRDRYDAEVPTVVDAVHRERPVFVEDAKVLRGLTDRPVKWTLPGPMTMIDTLADRQALRRASQGDDAADDVGTEQQDGGEHEHRRGHRQCHAFGDRMGVDALFRQMRITQVEDARTQRAGQGCTGLIEP